MKIKYTITVYVPGNVCNFRCNYCYISNAIEAEHSKKAEFNYSLERMIEAFDPKRLGGIASVIIIGSGETLIPDEVVPFVHGLLDQGHYVEVVTNMVLSDKIDSLINTSKDNLSRLLVKGSLHWLELKRLNKVELFFNNMNRIISAGASSFPFFVVCNDYMPYLEEIRESCLKYLGALPQCSPCVVYGEADDFYRNGRIMTEPECNKAFVEKIDSMFQSKIFDICVEFFEIDPKEIFCYAGQWSFIVDMGTGNVLKCHSVSTQQNFFDDIDKKYVEEPVGCDCGIASCMLQYNFIGQGIIPEIPGVMTYGEMLESSVLVKKSFTDAMKFKYYDSNKIYSSREERKIITNIYYNKMKRLKGIIAEKNNIIQQCTENLEEVNEYLETLKKQS